MWYEEFHFYSQHAALSGNNGAISEEIGSVLSIRQLGRQLIRHPFSLGSPCEVMFLLLQNVSLPFCLVVRRTLGVVRPSGFKGIGF